VLQLSLVSLVVVVLFHNIEKQVQIQPGKPGCLFLSDLEWTSGRRLVISNHLPKERVCLHNVFIMCSLRSFI